MSSKRVLDVVAAFIHQKQRIFLAQRMKDDNYPLLWEFPGGKVEFQEKRKDALRRELQEELGILAEIGKLVGIFTDENDFLKIFVYLYEVSRFEGEIKNIECNNSGFFTLDEILGLDLSPVDRKIHKYILNNFYHD